MSKLCRISLCTAQRACWHLSTRTSVKKEAVLLSSRRHLSIHAEAEDIDDPGIYEVILPPDPPVWGVSNIIRRTVPEHIKRPPYVLLGNTAGVLAPSHGDPYQGDGRIELGNDTERCLRRAAALANRVLSKAEELVRVSAKSFCNLNQLAYGGSKVGITTNEIDAAIHNFIVDNNAYPSPLGYAGFPKSCCTSVNNIVTHGIPDESVIPCSSFLRN